MNAGGEQFDWSLLVPRTIHEVKVAIIEALQWIGQPLAASELAYVIHEIDNEKFGLSHVSYHMNRLEELGALKVVKKEQVRGAMKKYYWFPPQQPR
jgi:DNA-binding transcriptional ArsR family regulator